MKLITDIFNKLFGNIEPEPSISEQVSEKIRVLTDIVIVERVSKIQLTLQNLKRAKLNYQINQQIIMTMKDKVAYPI